MSAVTPTTSFPTCSRWRPSATGWARPRNRQRSACASVGGASRSRRRSRRARTRRPARRSTWRSPPPTTCSTASASPTGCAGRRGTMPPRRCTAATASSTTPPWSPNISPRAPAASVSVLDVDYHHGNGTQQIFYDRGDVQFVSLHGDPHRAYPYLTGFKDEVGTGVGRGTTSNFPLPERTGDEEYLDVLHRGVRRDRRLRARLPRGVTRARHVRRGSDRRPGADRRRLRGRRHAWSARSGCTRSCCKRAAMRSTNWARTPAAGCAASPTCDLRSRQLTEIVQSPSAVTCTSAGPSISTCRSTGPSSSTSVSVVPFSR